MQQQTIVVRRIYCTVYSTLHNTHRSNNLWVNEQHACLAVGFIIRKQKTTKLFVSMHFTLGPWQRNNERSLHLLYDVDAFFFLNFRHSHSRIKLRHLTNFGVNDRYFVCVCMFRMCGSILCVSILQIFETTKKKIHWCWILLKKFLFYEFFFLENLPSFIVRFKNESTKMISRLKFNLLERKKKSMGMITECTKYNW